MFLIYIAAWIILSFLVAKLSANKKISFSGTLILSLIFSPIIGILFVIASDKKEVISSQAIKSFNDSKSTNYELISKLDVLKAKGLISEAKFENEKRKLLLSEHTRAPQDSRQ